MKRAFSNILDNAVKYNVDHGRIKISVTICDGDLCITIKNTGAGVPEDEIPRVFDQFYRVENSRSSDMGVPGWDCLL